MTLDDWCRQVDTHIGQGPDATGDEHSQPVVLLVGAYNTAKTSLVRRLLADGGLPIPEWARVSGREETASINSVEVAGCVLTDTPGLEALSAWHADETAHALLEADVIVALTTTNLFASEADADAESISALDVISGRAFHPDGMSQPTAALAVLVTRFDESGLDPTDFPEEYESSRIRKLAELRNLLAAHAPKVAQAVYLDAVAPDPFGRTRNRAAVRVDYDSYRAWDGMDRFAKWLADLPGHLTELRPWREVRRRSVALARRSALLQEALTEHRATEAQAVAGHSEAAQLLARCERDAQGAASRLSAALDHAVYAAPAPTDPQFGAELKKLLESEFERWADETWSALQNLAAASESALPTIERGNATDAAERLAELAHQTPDWQSKVRTTKSVIEVATKALDILVGRGEAAPVDEAAGPLIWLTPGRLRMLDATLTAASDFLEIADKEGSQRSADREYHRGRLQREGQKAADQLFTTPESPEGWRGLFETLSSAAARTATHWSEEAASAKTGRIQVEEDLARTRQLLADCPHP